jgi:beta-1,4-mannooligosaccharide/beta-1,4-mannosyl-N-acetylglucosamine phosphorylase
MQNPPTIGELSSSPLIQRHPNNPILAPKDVPYGPQLVFNVGVARYQGRYVMVFRNDYGQEGKSIDTTLTNIGLAYSGDGIHWDVQPKPIFTLADDENLRAYDPRLTVIDGRMYMCFAVDTRHGLRAGIAETEDFEHFEIKTLSLPDNRNVVLFPEKIGGNYVRLDRPFPVYSRPQPERFDVWLSQSPDLRYWGDSSLVLGVEDVPFANRKIGPGAPPVKTPKGWLTLFHAVDFDSTRGKNGWEEQWQKRYTAGIMLLDLQDPRKIVGLYRQPLIAPEAAYEADQGFRTKVIFATGMILEDNGEVKIYYGAADTVTCLATASLDDLLRLCLEGK